MQHLRVGRVENEWHERGHAPKLNTELGKPLPTRILARCDHLSSPVHHDTLCFPTTSQGVPDETWLDPGEPIVASWRRFEQLPISPRKMLKAVSQRSHIGEGFLSICCVGSLHLVLTELAPDYDAEQRT